MIKLTQANPSYDWDGQKNIGRSMTLGSSGELAGARFIFEKREESDDDWEPEASVAVSTDEHLSFAGTQTSRFYRIRLADTTPQTDVSVAVNYVREHQRHG